MKKPVDIANKNDIEILINAFYEKVKKDALLSGYFEDTNWEKHLPIMYDFWENVLFFSGKYNGDPMNVHRHLNNLIELKAEHFRRWNYLFNLTIDELFEGENAERAKQRALSIATVMQVKLSESASKKE